MMGSAAVVVGAALLASVACSPTATPSVPTADIRSRATAEPTAAQAKSSGVAIIEAAEQYFNPDLITVSVGTTVVWNDVQGTHDMVADDKSFASAVLFE